MIPQELSACSNLDDLQTCFCYCEPASNTAGRRGADALKSVEDQSVRLQQCMRETTVATNSCCTHNKVFKVP